MKNCDKNKESPYIQYWNVNNLYVWTISQKLPKTNFEWIEESDKGYFLEVDVQYTEKLPFLPKRMKIEKVEKLVANLHDKMEYVIHIRNLKQAWTQI